MPIRVVLERSLGDIHDELLRLASMVDRSLADSMRALTERNGNLAQQVSHDDNLLNEARYTVEEKCYGLIATQQPNTTDLRVLVGAVSVATNLERMGDHSAGIARLTLRMIDQPPIMPLVDIPQMAAIAREMVKGSVDAFLDHNATLAEQIVQRDRDVDQLHVHVYHRLLAYMTQNPANIERATFMLWVSHNLERIGDRATNICERAIYVATGQLKEFN